MADIYPYDNRYNHSSSASSDDNNDPPSKNTDLNSQKPDSKPQATFLTKLYALLERPENHHMIRWDPAGEHIIVERPEQLALHVLPSIYRQSRFASFSRQLNIYGFMRKVNLRNVDPAIDDPDASTWSHPTLNRHSPPEVVANFKRRVPPRLPKPRKRDVQDLPSIPPPRSAMGIGHIPLTVPSSVANHNKLVNSGRARGFSLPSTMAPLNQLNSNGWSSNNYNRSALPPLMVPSDPPHLSQSNGIYSPHPLDDPSSSNFHSINSYSSSTRDLVVPSSQYSNSSDQNNWSSFNNGYNPSPSHNGSNLSSLLNPPVHNSYSRPNTSINTSSYTSPFSSMPLTNEHSGSSLSPESRPTTGYSMSSVSSLPYQDDYSRPSSSTHHHRPISPPRPPSSKSTYGPGSLSVRRARRHSQAMSPYPNPYDPNEHQQQQQQRPSTSPTPIEDHQSQTHPDDIPRVRSMIQLPSVDPYAFSNHDGGAEFAYSALPTTNHHHHHQVGHSASTLDSINDAGGWPGTRNIQVRPSTATSSISAASHTTSSSSQANTPPIQENFDGETDINRFSPDFGFVPMNEHLSQDHHHHHHHHYSKVAGEL